MKKSGRHTKNILNKKDVLGFILVRLVITTALIIAAVPIQFGTATNLPVVPFYLLILLLYILSALYFGLYVWGKYLFYQVYLQIFLDLLIITAFVYISGGLENSFSSLYVFEIIAASVILSKRAAFVTATLSAVWFGILVDGMVLGLIPYVGDGYVHPVAQGDVLRNLITAWGVFFAVAFLVNYLVDKLRKTKRDLFETQRELETKRRLALAGEISAQMAHEIRNPLAAISGSVQVLKKDLDLPESQKKLMDIVVHESERVSKTLNHFLANTLDRGRHFTRLDLSEACKETLFLMKKSGELNGNCRVTGNFRSSPCAVYGDKDQLKQIFWNLINNSLKSMQGGGTLTIDFSKKRKDRVEIKIRDTGQGMTAEVRARMFDPFYSGFSAGQGIGMSVVKRIVEDYGGEIAVQSEINRGTEVVIALPAEKTAGLVEEME